jgi:hypothetical protein
MGAYRLDKSLLAGYPSHFIFLFSDSAVLEMYSICGLIISDSMTRW